MAGWSLFIAVFLACIVEAVEATTIVLAAGTARSWRSALLGVGAGMLVLAAIIGLAGPAISRLPLEGLRLVVGGLLLVFGLQWIRKAVLRSGGYKALHDEDAIFQTRLASAQRVDGARRGTVFDGYGFTLSFKGVLLEGLEVAFIVLTFGTIQNQVGLAALAAAGAVVIVAIAGFAVRKPLSRIPENTLKFIVGIMLTSFGIFWGAEGAGSQWPGSDLALPVIVVFVAAISIAFVGFLRTRNRPPTLVVPVRVGVSQSAVDPVTGLMPAAASAVVAGAEIDTDGPTRPRTHGERRSFGSRLRAFGLFWYDFIVGDDWQVTAGIVVSFALTFWLAELAIVNWWLVPAAVLLLLPYSIFRATRLRLAA